MPMKLLSADEFRSAAKDGQSPEGTLFKFATTEPEAQGGEDSRTMRFVFSDATVDHSGDSIDPKGWDLGIFKRNPVALFAHTSWDPPIGRASNVTVHGDQLVGDIEFAAADVYDFADTIYRLVKGGFLKAVSVGFMPKEWAFSADKNRPYGIDFKKQQLLEISVCPVPCNPNALGEARSLGIDTRSLSDWAEKVLDNGDTVFMPRKDVEALRVQAKGVEAPRFYLQATGSVSVDLAEQAREAVKRWQADPADIPVLPQGLALRSIASDTGEAPEAIEADDGDTSLDDVIAEALKTPTKEALQRIARVAHKAGRRISAATKATLEEAMNHHAAATDCIKAVISGDEPDDEEPDEELEVETALTPEPLGSDVPEVLTPEERRLQEARALKASIPSND